MIAFYYSVLLIMSGGGFPLTCTGSQHGLLLNAEAHLSHSLLNRLPKHLERTDTFRARQAGRGARAVFKQDRREVFHLWHCLPGELNLPLTFTERKLCHTIIRFLV